MEPHLQELQRLRKLARQAVRDFVEGAASGDLNRMAQGYGGIEAGEGYGGGWARAMRAVGRLPSVPSTTQNYFLRVYLSHGDHIRLEGEDLALADGLRVLLPPYDGAAMRLYRGEGARNRARRTYGLAWTSDIEVARGYAERGFQRTTTGGSVLLETMAPKEAIICAPALIDDSYGESEYIVDRRRLTSANVIERFGQLSPFDMRSDE